MKTLSAIKTGPPADEHHREKIDSLGDPLVDIASHVDLASLAAHVDLVAPRPGRARVRRPRADGGKLLSTIGQARANFAMTMMGACYNLQRLVYFRKAGIEAF